MAEIDQPPLLLPKAVERLTGGEAFLGSELTVLDFWQWGFSDLRTNIVRGVLAEFLVARAVGDPSPLRNAWDNFDVTTPLGVRVEVKSSAYLQSWAQRRISNITFGGLSGRPWFNETALSMATSESFVGTCTSSRSRRAGNPTSTTRST